MSTGPKFYAIIPVRYASTRFPAKALALIGDKPLFWHAYTRAKQSGCFEAVYLATDDDRIEEKAKEFGIPFIHTSTEHSTGTDRVREAAKILDLPQNSVVANIQGDEPFLTHSMFRALIEPFCQVGVSTECATLGVMLDRERDKARIQSSNQVKIVLGAEERALYFSRLPIPFDRDNSQKAPYIGHVGIYAFRYDILERMANLAPSPLEETEKLEQLRLLENNISIKVGLIESSPHGVDTAEDLEAAKAYYQEHSEFWT